MTATEKIAIAKIASLTDDQLFATWESTEKYDRENHMAQVMLRGWCMDEIEKRYRANPVTFHQEVAAARRQPAAAPAAEPTEPAQEPESKPLY